MHEFYRRVRSEGIDPVSAVFVAVIAKLSSSSPVTVQYATGLALLVIGACAPLNGYEKLLYGGAALFLLWTDKQTTGITIAIVSADDLEPEDADDDQGNG